jgi:hypothetical protein
MSGGSSQGNPANAIPVYVVSGVNAGVGGTVLNITTPTVIKAAPGQLISANVIVAGSAPGTVNDCLTTGAAAAANQVGTLPNAVGPITFNFPCLVGIVVVPGAGQTVAVSFA